MTRALLVRHCESAGQAAEAPLSMRGRVQAEVLADFLSVHPVSRIVSSPYRRAQETIEPFARISGLAVEIDDRLAERRLSPQPIDGWRDVVRRSFDDPEYRVPGGESGAETLARGLGAIRPVIGDAGGLAVIVSHGQLLSLVLHSIDPAFGFRGWESLSNPDVHLLEPRGDGALAFRRVWS